MRDDYYKKIYKNFLRVRNASKQESGSNSDLQLIDRPHKQVKRLAFDNLNTIT
jgi:hypothetical protein